jgi:hypothetical protein
MTTTRDMDVFLRPRVTCGDHTIGLGNGLPLAPIGEVEAMRSRLLKDAHSLAEHSPVPVRARNSCFALDRHKNHFAIWGRFRDCFAGSQPPERKSDVTPARRTCGDLVHLPVATEGLAEKFDHRLSFPIGSPEAARRVGAGGINRRFSGARCWRCSVHGPCRGAPDRRSEARRHPTSGHLRRFPGLRQCRLR